jgi:hypothetical protein
MISQLRKISDEHHKASIILLTQFATTLLILFLRGIYGPDQLNMIYLLKFFFFLVFFNFYYKTLKNLNYTFWSFTVVLILINANALLFLSGSQARDLIFNLNLFVLLLSLVLAYIMSSPVFFPRVQWWEYDFRYRGDLKIKVELASHLYSARLTDLRRGAGCIVMFKDVPIGQELKVLFRIDSEEREYTCKVISKREYSPGRGITYGVKFYFEKQTERKNFLTFSKDWERSKRVKLRAKFNDKTDIP